jgi:membrane protease YdiL (CAAX protease family)
MPVAPRRWIVWAALLAPPFVLAATFLPVVAYYAGARGLHDDALLRAIERVALVPAALAFVVVFLLARAAARGAGWSLADVGWRRPRARELVVGVAVAIAAVLVDGLWARPWLRAVQPSFDPTLPGVPLAAVVVALGTGIVAEETLYRGVAWRVLRERHGAAVAVGATTLAYVLLAPGFAAPLKIWTLGFGLLLAAVRAGSDGLWPVVVVHAAVSFAPKVHATIAGAP